MGSLKAPTVISYFCLFSLPILADAVSAPGNETHLIDMGEPISAVVIADAAYGHGKEGEPLMYVLGKGPPALFDVIDVRTGQRVFEDKLHDTKMSWGMDVGPDGSVYIATNTRGRLYRWRPGANQVEDLGRMIEGETHLWELKVAGDGRVYSGTYPGGRAFEYDPESGQVRDFGRISEGADYARGIAVSERFLFVGTGARVGQLFQIDRETGQKTEIALPPGANPTLIGNLSYHGGLLFTPVQIDNEYLVYDVANELWQQHRLTLPSAPGPDGNLYSLSGNLYRYDPAAGEWTSTGYRPDRGGARSYGWLDLDDPAFPGPTLVSTDMRGRYWLYNPTTGKGQKKTADVRASPVPLRSMFTGPDGRIYIGGYLSPGAAAAYDPATKEMITLSGIGQVEGWGTHGNQLYSGVYPNAAIHRTDMTWEWNYGSNPEHVFSIGDQQDRPFAFAAAGRHLAIGTVPKAGQLGGALTILDTETGERETFRHVVKDQSIVSLAYHEETGLLVGGSSVSGGLGIEPAAREGALFLWDIAKREKIWSGTPVAGQMGVTGLTIDAKGMVWGATGQNVFCFDPKKRAVLRVIDLFPAEQINDPATEWVNGFLNFHGDGNLYGQVRGRVFRLDPATGKVDELIRRASYFAQDKFGDIYFARDEQTLYRLPLSKVE